MERVILRHLKGSKASQLEEFPLQQFVELVLGRDPSASVRFDPEKDDLVGRQHARIARDPGDPYRFKLADLNSRNGTYLNKLRVVGEMPLQPGDVIQLGAGGPELQFDLDPLPAQYVKATRLAVGGAHGVHSAPVSGVSETRVGQTAAAGASPEVSGSPRPVSVPSAAPAPNAIGKATVERMIGETKQQGRRNTILGVAAAIVILAGLGLWQKSRMDEQQRRTAAASGQLADSLRRLQVASAGEIDSLKSSLGRASELSKASTPAEIAAKYGKAVVQVDFSWKLEYRPTGGQVYHHLVANQYKDRRGVVHRIIDNGRENIKAYIQLSNGDVEPYLTLDPSHGVPIGVSSSGSGFVVSSNGFVLTNRHVAYNWQTWYRFDPQDDVGVLVDPRSGRLMLDEAGNIALTNPPATWIPSETKQAGPKGGDIGDFQARTEYLYVRFPKDPTPFEAKGVRPSQRHDVALIKVDAPSTLTYVNMVDTYNKTQQGDAVTVMGYPGISSEIVTVIRSKDMFNREAQQRILPEPTLSQGYVGKVLRAADAEVKDGFLTFAPSGDTYQLTINSTGGGNSGGPMFDAFGNVTGIFFASRRGDAMVTFSIPIKYGMELLVVGDPTAGR